MEHQTALLEEHLSTVSLECDHVGLETGTESPAATVALAGAGVIWKVYATLGLAIVAFLVAVAGMASGVVPTPHL